MKQNKLPISFFRRRDVVKISRELLGHYLFTHIDSSDGVAIAHSGLTGGIITETEAYAGVEDRASHAFENRRTRRTEIMFQQGGVSYVYLCYGIHRLLNIVTNIKNVPDAVLIRAIEPTHGIDIMLARRNKRYVNRSLTTGPGVLSQALGIDLCHSGISIVGNRIWVESGRRVAAKEIHAGPRVGVQYAGSDALRPWRFRLRAKGGSLV